MTIVVLHTPKEAPKPNWESGHVNLLRDINTAEQVLAFRCPGAQATGAAGVLFLRGDKVTYGGLRIVQLYYTFERSILWSEVKVEVSL